MTLHDTTWFEQNIYIRNNMAIILSVTEIVCFMSYKSEFLRELSFEWDLFWMKNIIIY